MVILVIALIALLAIMGVSMSADSYATAQMAQAQIETARAAQISASGNLVTILTGSLVIVLLLLGIMALVALYLWKRSTLNTPKRHSVSSETPAMTVEPRQQISIQDLMQLEMLRTLQSMRGGNSLP